MRGFLHCAGAVILCWALVSCVNPDRDNAAEGGNKKAPGGEKGLQVDKAVVGAYQTNCWLVWDPASGRGMVIDPGAKWKKIMAMIEKNKAGVTAIVWTHGHGDHIAATYQLLEKTDTLLYRHPSRLENWGAKDIEERFPDRVRDIDDGDTLEIGPFRFEVIHTPGHSPGGISLYGEGMLFSGDLLFRGSVGRSDLAGGDLSELMKSLNERIARLPDDTRVLPGHGPETTLGAERRTNPYLRPPPAKE